MKRFSLRGIILGIISLGLLGGLTYLIISLASTDWRTYNIDEVENLFSSYYSEESFTMVDDSADHLSDVGIIVESANDLARKVLIMKNFELGNPSMSDEDIAAGYKYRYLLLETGLTAEEVETDYDAALINIENTRDYYMENEEGNETLKNLYADAIIGKGHDYVYVIIGDEAELMKREMEMLLK